MGLEAALEYLKCTASERGIPLNRLYMACLRQRFLQGVAMEELVYGQWVRKSLGTRWPVEDPLSFTCEGLGAVTVSELLALGDVCASEQAATGSFYTPPSIARFMAENALRQVLISRFPEQGELIERYFSGERVVADDAQSIQLLMCQLRIIDLACGNGVFLNACLDCYCALGELSGFDPQGLQFVAQSLCGVDIRPDALESWAISLGNRSPGFLTDIPALKGSCISSVAGDAMLEIPWVQEILLGGGFDLVIGNPPYLGEKGNRQLFEKLKESPFGQRYYEGRMDLFYFFIHRGIELLKSEGILCQITTSYYATADFASKLRDHLKSSGGITGLVSFNEQRVFAGALGHHVILFYQKGSPKGLASVISYHGAKRLKHYDFEDLSFRQDSPLFTRYVLEDRGALFDEKGHIILDPSRWETDDLEVLNHSCPEKLKDLVKINQGIVSGADRSDSGGIFVLEPGEIFKEAEPWLVPWYKNGDIRRYRTSSDTDKRLIYLGNEKEETLPVRLMAHFEPHREKLSSRRECQSGARPWHGLQWPRERSIFEGPKLVAPQRSTENRFAYTEGPWFASADVYFLTKPVEGISLWALMAYLNSDRLYHWFLHCGKRKGKMLELYATPLGNVPVNRRWLEPEGELDRLGKALYAAAGRDEPLVKSLRKQVEDWLENMISEH